ncbi:MULTISPECIES: hypothetical protein [Klebsiella]|jgi:hypothetical protein|uniref:hypothetical protein n=1 Tax=Klebsiella TaxID=570 RepID=UPI0004A84D67|nr:MULTISPECIES: hypothetical protein [Klebsiella]AID99695.1 hypothetical protein A593_03685 [Klebsiella variicola]HCB0479524.1 hypothetical protein [Klebsiella variicola subsp. variicola]HDW1350557.1 hypothetical protein [Klebsiella michiganensis]MCS6701377.1 hypothetical protein [Klebsiella pneumoniae subsp. pneumoniae]PXK55475.1 hypothetical protein DMR96_03735 [Klebsiella pneumoniae]
MSEEIRRVILTNTYDKKEGTFIKYAPIETYDESGQMRTPEKAIVETDDGKVYTVDPSKIQFLK